MTAAKSSEKTVVVSALFVSFICLLVYLRAFNCDFVNWEDQDYVLNNQGITTFDLDMFRWAFTSTPVGSFWIPLTYISFALDYHFWGLNPAGYHLTNILLHSINAALVVVVTDLLYRERFSAHGLRSEYQHLYPLVLVASGLLFALHPTHVESVVWVTERKDVLNGAGTLGAIICYLRYVRLRCSPAGKGKAWLTYGLAVILFACSLMAKPSSVVLPAMLLVIDWYPLSRLRRETVLPLVLEKIPFVLCSVAITLVTIMVSMRIGDFSSLNEFSLADRVIASGNALFEYVRVMLYPVGIIPHYDLPKEIPVSYAIKGGIAVCAIIWSLWLGKRYPWWRTTVLLFFIPLVPILPVFANGTVQVIILSRYTYLPSMLAGGILIASFAETYVTISPEKQRIAARLLIPLMLVAGMVSVVTTERLIGVWKDSAAMWSRVIAYRPFDKAYFFRGLHYVDSGEYDKAVTDYTTCLSLARANGLPDLFNIHAFRGEALLKAGRFAEALQDFDIAIKALPHKLYFYNRSLALRGLGKIREADDDLRRSGGVTGQMFWFPVGAPL